MLFLYWDVKSHYQLVVPPSCLLATEKLIKDMGSFQDPLEDKFLQSEPIFSLQNCVLPCWWFVFATKKMQQLKSCKCWCCRGMIECDESERGGEQRGGRCWLIDSTQLITSLRRSVTLIVISRLPPSLNILLWDSPYQTNRYSNVLSSITASSWLYTLDLTLLLPLSSTHPFCFLFHTFFSSVAAL